MGDSFENILDSYIEQKLMPKITEVIQREIALNMDRKFPKLYTREETLKIFHVSEATLWHWENKEILVPVRVGKKVFYTEDEIRRVTNL